MEDRVEVELRRKNQLTWPEPIARRMKVREGSRLVIEFDEARQEARVRPILESYAGTMPDVYGETPEEIARYLEEERQSWGQM
jgi:bifunctional DNA-binding transcriptional regulator/antitoxin component of YhaV-PrlF toxin-antitoxin module